MKKHTFGENRNMDTFYQIDKMLILTFMKISENFEEL